MSESILHFIDFPEDGPGDSRRIAVRTREGTQPAVVWLSGFRSDMRGIKATELDRWGERSGRAVVRLDYSGHGESGGRFEDGTISRWLEESVAVFQQFCRGPQVVIGSSMGGWIALLLAREMAKHAGAGFSLAGLVLIPRAPDFTEELMWKGLAPEVARDIGT